MNAGSSKQKVKKIYHQQFTFAGKCGQCCAYPDRYGVHLQCTESVLFSMSDRALQTRMVGTSDVNLNPDPNPNPGTSNPYPAESESIPFFLESESSYSESESTLFFLNPNPESYILALNPNPNPAKKALNLDSNPDSDSHITGRNFNI